MALVWPTGTGSAGPPANNCSADSVPLVPI